MHWIGTYSSPVRTFSGRRRATYSLGRVARVASVIVAAALVVAGVVFVVLGLRTHPEVKVGRNTYPLSMVRQVGGLSGSFPVVQVRHNWWEVAFGGLLIVEGEALVALSVTRSRALIGAGLVVADGIAAALTAALINPPT